MNLADLKRKIQGTRLLSVREKEEWLLLLPKMNERQLKELEKILSAEKSTVIASPAKRDEAISLGHGIATPRRDVGARDDRKAAPPPPPKPLLGLAYIKSLEVKDLKHAPTIYLFLENLLRQMQRLVQERKASAEEVVAAFESGALYQSYLRSGLAFLSDKKATELTHEQFEAISSFRDALKQKLG